MSHKRPFTQMNADSFDSNQSDTINKPPNKRRRISNNQNQIENHNDNHSNNNILSTNSNNIYNFKKRIRSHLESRIINNTKFNLKLIQSFKIPINFNSNHTNLYIGSGSVVDFSGECIVNAANEGMLGGGGVDGAISDAGGDALNYLREQLPLLTGNRYKRCNIGDAKLTLSGYPYNKLKCDYIIHAVGPNYCSRWRLNDNLSIDTMDKLLFNAYKKCMDLAKEKDIKSIAFCLISSSIFRGTQSLENVIKIGIKAIMENIYDGLECFIVAFTKNELDELCRVSMDLMGEPDSIYSKVNGVQYGGYNKMNNDNNIIDENKDNSKKDENIDIMMNKKLKLREQREKFIGNVLNQYNKNDNNKKEEKLDNSNNGNLGQNRITTTTETAETETTRNCDENKKKKEYEAAKQRIMYDTPSPITSPEYSPCSIPATPGMPTPTTSSTASISNDLSFSLSPNIATSTNEDDIKRQIDFGRNNKEKLHIDDGDKRKKEEMNEELRRRWIDDEFDTASSSNGSEGDYIDGILRDDMANGIYYNIMDLRQRRGFRNYVLSNLNDKYNRSRIKAISFTFGILFAFWSIINIFYFKFYDTMNILVPSLIILTILRDLNDCNGDYGLSIIIMFTFLMRKLIEFMIIKKGSLKNGYDLKLYDDMVLYGLLMTMLYLFMFDEFHWNAIQERIFNRGFNRRLIAYGIYFWFNGYMVVELISILYGKRANSDLLMQYLYGNKANIVIVCGYIAIVMQLWWTLQITKYIHIIQYKLNEFCGFLVMIMINYCYFFSVWQYGKESKENFVDQKYVLFMLTVVLLLHKLLYF